MSTDAKRQLAFLEQFVAIVETLSHPKAKNLRAKFRRPLERIRESLDAGGDPQQVALDFAADLKKLRNDAIRFLNGVVNDLRAMLSQSGALGPRRQELQQIQESLGLFAKGLRKYGDGLDRHDPSIQASGIDLIEQANRNLERP